ncbi:DUF3322 and DUF2220 domain-containing protein [uncultured Bifidobacterium sp.]|uniref:DUF3322 and DUF2220 domain-containing protein n=1 Tax=uncultured Bifidobacterium sp. TaxID=165187 RepID=UPI002597E994|nr:DUF3322 and DUF2220 domain-containing protein [uncultured Bifidobacterium sp.]
MGGGTAHPQGTATPDDLRRWVARTVEREMFAVDDPWPRTKAVQWPKEVMLVSDVNAVHDANNALKDFAARYGCDVTFTARRLGARVMLIDHVTVPDEQAALAIAGGRLRHARERVLARAAQIEQTCGVAPEVAMRAVQRLGDETDVDFALFTAAAAWFGAHDNVVAAMTAREVPLEGFSAKWLGGARSRRRAAICTVLGVDALLLRERPEELRYRYLDPAAAGAPDRIAVTPQREPEHSVRRAIIVENKDTYQAMPAFADALCVFGSGFAAVRAARLLPFLADCDVVYWGDLDAVGFEILAAVRASGVDCVSILMDRATYTRYMRFGTRLDAHSRAIGAREPLAASAMRLDDDEYALYCALCTPGEMEVPRIEQERIPIACAVEALRSIGW